MQVETQGGVPAPSARSSKRQGLTLLLLFLVLILLVGGVALFLHQQAQAPARQLPVTIHWQKVLQRYSVDTLVAAPGHPNLLYACGLPALPEFDPNTILTPTHDNPYKLPSGVFLRSSDAGVHWQVFKAALGDALFCSLAVNPSNANDLYLTAASVSPLHSVLKHSSNGGQTWTTIPATLTLPSHTQHVAWEGGQLNFVGKRLFSVQRLQGFLHLISSRDGGHTWTVLDASLFSAHQEMLSGAIDPADPATIYELVGVRTDGWFSYAPVGATPTPTPSPVPADQLTQHLYKTSDGGVTWREILSSIPYGSSLQLARAHSNLLYVGGLTPKMSSTAQSTFHMQYSADGGKSWQFVALPANANLHNNWLVAPSGLLYVAASDPGKQPGDIRSIQCYDLSTRQWYTLAVPASTGTLRTVTSSTSGSGDVLWFANMDVALYRGTL